MIRTLIIGLLIFLVHQDEIYSQSDATKLETFEWIQSKMNDYQLWSQTVKYVPGDNGFDKEISGKIYIDWKMEYSLTECKIYLKRNYFSDDLDEKTEIEIEIPLETLDYKRIKIWGENDGSNYSHISLFSTNERESIKIKRDDGVEVVSYISIEVRTDSDIHNRMKKALEHLIKLCGGKTEKF